MIAFGGGVLLSAVSLVLVPDGVKQLSLPWVIAAFLSGGLSFILLDLLLSKLKNSMAQLAAMLSDFIPEAIALGAGFATGDSTGMLLAILISRQNLPEGFNAYRELHAGGSLPGKTILTAFLLLVPLGPIAGDAGYLWLSGYPKVVAFMMLYAASGILYMTFQDIAPQAQLKNGFAPALGAVLGFLLGLVGQQLVQ